MENKINDINSILHSNAKFKYKFCEKKFNSNFSKCKSFYLNNIKNSFDGISTCPYGYTCVFGKSKVISSLIDTKYSDLNVIRNRNKYEQKCSRSDEKQTVLSFGELNALVTFLKDEDIYYEYRDTFHDLSNNNRYLKDIIQKLDLKAEIKNQKNIIYLINKMMKIFEEHNKNVQECINDNSKKSLYYYEIDQIDSIKNILLKIKYVTDNLELKDNLRFIDYRIRYLKRLTEGDGNVHQDKFVKDLNIYNMIIKLRYSLKATLIKKQQQLKINSIENDECIFRGYDDVFLGLFILLENSIKYAPLNSIIEVYINKDELGIINVEISNNCDEIEDYYYLKYRGVVGSNHKEGNGLGLSIASQIFESSNIEFDYKYSNKMFFYYLRIICK